MSIDSYKCRSISGDRQLSPSTVTSVDGQFLTVEVKKGEVLLMALTSHRTLAQVELFVLFLFLVVTAAHSQHDNA